MKLNGYRASHRNKWFLITKKILTLQEFLLFEFYLDQMNFDKDNKDKFASFEVYLEEIAPIFNKSIDTIRLWHNGLLYKNFIKIVDPLRQLFTVKSPLRYVIGLTQWGGESSRYATEEKDQTQEFILKNIRFFPSTNEKVQPESVKKTDISTIITENSLSSSKCESIDISSIGSKKIVVISQKLRSEEEYQRIYQDGDFQNLTPDDMKWIDQNVKEQIPIESDKQEKEIVEVFFNGDWNEYQKHIIYQKL